MDPVERPALATRCVHAGAITDAHGSPHTPLYQTTTFRFASTADLPDVVGGCSEHKNNACLSRRLRVLCAGSQFK
jgi:O-acetylhomoserine/O-acetylserine sulfhydrylase-like pyridoxal-dependent enzyme